MRSFIVVFVAACMAIGVSAQGARTELGDVLERLDDYLAVYETELGAVVADEQLIQETDGRLMASKRTRRLNSEIAFVRLPGNLEWLGFRNVRVVDGKPLLATKTLAELLATRAPMRLRRQACSSTAARNTTSATRARPTCRTCRSSY